MARFKKQSIPQAVRRALALANGCSPFQTVDASCRYCGAKGRIHWITRSWVWFEGLEMDHVIPESLGGETAAKNLVLACRRCNRSKGASRA